MNISQDADTIAAPISALGQGGVAVVRISGPQTREILQLLVPRAEQLIANPRKMLLTPIFDSHALSDCSGPVSEEQAVLDQALAVFFKSPHSFTGEDCAEFHVHGSPYLVARLLELLCVQGLRLARPGEFTQRAFLNGRMDLSQAEAVADLVQAETEAQARVAREQLEGRLSKAVSDLGEPLRELLAEIEAYIDFPDEEVEVASQGSWISLLKQVCHQIQGYIDSYAAGRVCREGAQVVLAGVPNAGKSSMLNVIVGEERAIVTAIPGTTRDSIEERVSIHGLYVRFCDTAGLISESEHAKRGDEVERLGVERSWKRVRDADLVLFVFDAGAEFSPQEMFYHSLSGLASAVLPVLNKLDICEETELEQLSAQIQQVTGQEPICVSAAKKEGFSELTKAIYQHLLGETRESGTVLITTQRHYDCLLEARACLERSISAIEQSAPPEIIALEIRASLGGLSDIIGIGPTEDILGRIFSRFCIGK